MLTLAAYQSITYPKLKDLKPGDKLIADGGFFCMRQGAEKIIYEGTNGDLCVPCGAGDHFLDGQLNDAGEVVGFTLAVSA